MTSKKPLFACAVTSVDGQAVTELPPRGKTHLNLTFTDIASGEPLKGMKFELRISRGRSTTFRFFDERGDGHKQTCLFGGLDDGTLLVKIGCTHATDQLTVSFVVEPMYCREDALSLTKDYGALTVSFRIATPVEVEEDGEDPQTAPSPISYLPPPADLPPTRQKDDLTDLPEACWDAFAEYTDESEVQPTEEADGADADVVELSFYTTSEDVLEEVDVVDESTSPACEAPPRVIKPLSYHEVDNSRPSPAAQRRQTDNERASVRLCSPNGSAAPTVPHGGMSDPMLVSLLIDGVPSAKTYVKLSFVDEECTGLSFKDADGDGVAAEEVLLQTDTNGCTPVFRLAHNGSARKRTVSLYLDYGKLAIGIPVLIVPHGEAITVELEEVVDDPPSHTPWDDHSPKVRSDPRLTPPPPKNNKTAALNNAFGDSGRKAAWKPEWDTERPQPPERERLDASWWALVVSIGLLTSLIATCGHGLQWKTERWDHMTSTEKTTIGEMVWSYVGPTAEKLAKYLETRDREDAEAKRAEKAEAKPEPAAPPPQVEVTPQSLPIEPAVVSTAPVAPVEPVPEEITHHLPAGRQGRPDPISVVPAKWPPDSYDAKIGQGVPIYPPTHYQLGGPSKPKPH